MEATEADAETDASSIAAAARSAVRSFVHWLDEFGERSFDPHDLWTTAVGSRAKALYYRHRLVGTLAAAPFVAVDTIAPRLRALFAAPLRYPIADAHYAIAFSRLAIIEHDVRWADRARTFLDALERSRSSLYDNPAWGYPFDWPSRYGTYRAGWPLVTSTPYGYEAFAAGHAALGDDRFLEVMEGAARFAAETIPVTEVAPGVEASAYSPFDRRQVVNASAYRGFLLISAGARFDREDWLAAGERNIAFVLHSQRRDGSWPYSVDGADDFVDNFHTCLVLKNLAKVNAVTPSDAVRSALEAGYDYYLANLLDEQGLPRPFARTPRLTLHRRDLYDYAEGINLGVLLRREIPAAANVMQNLVDDLLARWALPDGHFVTRKFVVGRNTLPYHRWAQSQAFHALVAVLADED